MSNGEDNPNGTDRRDSRREALRPSIVEGAAEDVPAAEASPDADAAEALAETTASEATLAAAATSADDEQTTEGGDADATPAEEPAPLSSSLDDGPEGPPDAEAETAPAERAPLPTARRASLIAAGLVGALLALGGYFGLHYAGLLPNDRNAVVDRLSTEMQDTSRRIAALESSIARAVKRDTSKEIGERLTGLETAVRELGAEPKNSLVRRLGDAEAKIEQLAQAAEGVPTAKEIDERLTYVEDKLAASGSAAMSTTGAATEDLTARLADIEARIETLESRPAVVSGSEPPSDAAVAALADRVTGIDTALASLRSDYGKLDESLAAARQEIDERITAFEKSVAERDTSELRGMARTTASALAVAALEKAADGSGPYGGELAALKPLLDANVDIAPLEAHAETGVPDLAALQAGFPAAANAILAADEPQAQGVLGAMLASARSLVRVRPSGKVEGEGRGATVARIEAALDEGDLATAAAEWKTLDEAARTASRSWGEALEARIAVDGALAGLASATATSLAGTAAKD